MIHLKLGQSGQDVCLRNFWDDDQARFRPCFLPVISLIPVVLAAVVLLAHVTTVLFPRYFRLIKPFIVEEIRSSEDELEGARSQKSTARPIHLLVVVVLGLACSVTDAILTWSGIPSSFKFLPWLVILVVAVLKMPRTVPFGLLAVAMVILVTHIVIATTHFGDMSEREKALLISIAICAASTTVAILNMPLRDPIKSTVGIASLKSPPDTKLRSPEDNLTLWQFMTVSWMTPLIKIGKSRQLESENVWQLAYEFQHSRLHDAFRQLSGTVISRLVQANIIDLLIMLMLGMFNILARFSVPVLLQRLLAAMENAATPKGTVMIWAILTLTANLVRCQIDVFGLWFGRRCYERSRGEMITMLYEKTLCRKIAFVEKVADQSGQNGQSTNLSSTKGSWNWFHKLRRQYQRFTAGFKSVSPIKEPASMGKILNLMRNDVYEVAQRFWEFQSIVTIPFGLLIALTLTIKFLGPTAWIAVAWLVVTQILTAIMSRLLVYIEKKRRVATDVKIQRISQFVEAIRHLRWYGWQGYWLQSILDARQNELHLRMISNIWQLLIGTMNSLGGDLAPAIAFFAYTTIAKQPLRIDLVFPTLSLFDLLNMYLRELPNLVIVIINAWVAVGRIEDFMAEPARDDMNTEPLLGDYMALENASFVWPGTSTPVLRDINISFPTGLTVIYGEVASGKTALLQALLGELDMLEGQLLRPAQPIGYCAQAPWLQSMSIRENILFSEIYDQTRYKSILSACALNSDLAEFKGGDLASIGENGVGLSGGQKARVALARALYSSTGILLLDDPFSALDQQTAESIVHDCFCSPLLAGRTIVLVTHRVDLVLNVAKQIIRLENGQATIMPKTHESLVAHVPNGLSKANGSPSQTERSRESEEAEEKFIEDEHRQSGGVKLSIYTTYVKAGKLRWWTLLIFAILVYRLFGVGSTYFLKVWSEAYHRSNDAMMNVQQIKLLKAEWTWDFTRDWPSPESNVRPWLTMFALLCLGRSIALITMQGASLTVAYVAARRMFRDVMDKVANATFRFYDVTPIGRLMNRMTSDIGVIDGRISAQLEYITWQSVSWVTSIIVVAASTPSFLIFMLLLVSMFVFIFLQFLPTSQSLRRLEMVSLTPLMSNFGALLDGLTTVRAFRVQDRFQARVIEVVDTFQKMDHFYWTLQTWLIYRFDIISAVSTFLLTSIALATNLSPGLTAFVLINANKYVATTQKLCKQYGELQMEFVSVERVVELLELEQEPKGTVSPPAWWPSFSGNVVFENVTIQYAPHLDPALDDISFTVKGGSKTAILGRTGSGKSTLALSILATILPSRGRILIDNVDLAEVDKQLLRTRITFLAQDPVLFPGTMRQNLDPTNQHSDSECSVILDRVCARQVWSLDTNIEVGGKNLSQGQRQLVGLARAVLRRSAIIVLDEATASIDRETALQIQQVMHEEMRDSTVITIAHRLEAVKNADYCIVLGKGKILRQGPADEMLNVNISSVDEDE